MNIKWTYYQFKKRYQYPVYVRLHPEMELTKLPSVLADLGLDLLSDNEIRQISLQKAGVKLLTIQEASGKIFQQLTSSNSLDQYGHEGLTIHSNIPFYTYRNIALMMTPNGKPLWDMAIAPSLHSQPQIMGMKVALTRFLSMALANFGIISYWGVSKDDGVIIMKQAQSSGESVFIDVKKKLIFSHYHESTFSNGLHIHRLDQTKKIGTIITREELLSFLSVSTCLLGFSGLTAEMKKSILDLAMGSSSSYFWQEGSLGKPLSYG